MVCVHLGPLVILRFLGLLSGLLVGCQGLGSGIDNTVSLLQLQLQAEPDEVGCVVGLLGSGPDVLGIVRGLLLVLNELGESHSLGGGSGMGLLGSGEGSELGSGRPPADGKAVVRVEVGVGESSTSGHERLLAGEELLAEALGVLEMGLGVQEGEVSEASLSRAGGDGLRWLNDGLDDLDGLLGDSGLLLTELEVLDEVAEVV